MTYRILITGSRTWTNEHAIRDALATLIAQHGPENVTIIHGACPHGADQLTDHIAQTWTGLTIERHPADWATHGKAAGPLRNQQMVDAGADICLAFVRDGSRGTRDCTRRAHAAGILVHEVTA